MSETAETQWPEVAGMRYLRTLGALHDILKPACYLEVGTFRGRSLSLCQGDYVAVDPQFKIKAPACPEGARRMFLFQMTSDDFFASDFAARNDIRFDLAFLDGLHHCDALLRDFMGAEKLMAPDGVIALHDCCPTTTEMTGREMTEGLWTGDVWKTVRILRERRPDLRIDVTTARPTGLALVRNLDPTSEVLDACYEEVVAEALATPTSDADLDAYYDATDLRDPREVLREMAAP
ncbi:MAG: class I SAM-dependent methyltransferase [Pseudomonadota bacterium]